MHIGPLFDYSIDDRYPVFAGKSMIDTFFKAIYHTYSFDNENTIKMNDSMMDIFHYVAFNSNLCSNETNF